MWNLIRWNTLIMLQTAIAAVLLFAALGHTADDPFAPSESTSQQDDPFTTKSDDDPFGGSTSGANDPFKNNTDEEENDPSAARDDDGPVFVGGGYDPFLGRPIPPREVPRVRKPSLRKYVIEVTDERGDPIEAAEVRLRAFNPGVGNHGIYEKKQTDSTGKATIYTRLTEEVIPTFHCMVAKNGFLSHHSSLERKDRDESDPTVIRVKLRQAQPVFTGTILNPDGGPADKAFLMEWQEFRDLCKYPREPNEPPSTFKNVAFRKTPVTDAKGNVTIRIETSERKYDRNGTFTTVPIDLQWLICTSKGAAVISAVGGSQTIRLQPWASLEGRIQVPAHLKEQEKEEHAMPCRVCLEVRYVVPGFEGRAASVIDVRYISKIDENNRYRFSQIVPGYGNLKIVEPNEQDYAVDGEYVSHSMRLAGDHTFDWDLSHIKPPKHALDKYRVPASAFEHLPENEATVRVVDPEGRPMPNVLVWFALPPKPGPMRGVPICLFDGPNFHMPSNRYPQIKTDDKGEVKLRFKGTALAVWSIYGSDELNQRLYYPQRSILTAVDVTKVDGPITFSMYHRPKYMTIGGTVVDQSGNPCSKVRVTIYYKSPTLPGCEENNYVTRRQTLTDEQGNWSEKHIVVGSTIHWIMYDSHGNEKVGPTTVFDPCQKELLDHTHRAVVPPAASLVLKNVFPKAPPHLSYHRVAIFSGDPALKDFRGWRYCDSAKPNKHATRT